MKAFKKGSVGGAGFGAFLGWVLVAGVAVVVIFGAGWIVYSLFGHLGWALAAGTAVTIILGVGWMFLAGAAVNSSLEDLADQQAAEAGETPGDSGDRKDGPGPISPHSEVAM